jgi:hypothetical protein
MGLLDITPAYFPSSPSTITILSPTPALFFAQYPRYKHLVLSLATFCYDFVLPWLGE